MTDVELRVRGMLEQSGISEVGADELVGLLAALEERYVDAVPAPRPELAALMGVEAPAVTPVSRLSVQRRRAIAAGVIALGAVVTTGLAAAANELPAPAQRWISELSQRYFPFDLPYPEDLPSDVERQSPDLEDDAGRKARDMADPARDDLAGPAAETGHAAKSRRTAGGRGQPTPEGNGEADGREDGVEPEDRIRVERKDADEEGVRDEPHQESLESEDPADDAEPPTSSSDEAGDSDDGEDAEDHEVSGEQEGEEAEGDGED